MNKKLIEKQKLAAAFLAAAAYKMLPDVQFIETGVDQLGFYYDLNLPYPFSEGQLEELGRFATEISSKAKISFKEMMLDNAKDYLNHLGQNLRKMNSFNSLVYLIEIDDFKDFIDIENSEVEINNFFIKLYKLKNIKDDIYRIHGLVFRNSKECSKFLKQKKDYEKNNYIIKGLKRAWFEINSNKIIYHPNGLVLKSNLIEMIKNQLRKLGFKQFESYPRNVLSVENNAYGCNKIFEVFYGKNSDISEYDLFNNEINIYIKQKAFIFKDEIELECISYLQSIIKMLNILSFRCEFKLCVSERSLLLGQNEILEKMLVTLGIKYELQKEGSGCVLNIFAKDKINRHWLISTLQLNENTIEGSFCSSLNRWIALLAENDDLNFEILPEHVRGILLDQKCFNYANEIKFAIESYGFKMEVDASDKSLNEKIFKANNEEIPFIVVIGEKESSSKTVALRVNNKAKMQRIELRELLEKLKNKGTT